MTTITVKTQADPDKALAGKVDSIIIDSPRGAGGRAVDDLISVSLTRAEARRIASVLTESGTRWLNAAQRVPSTGDRDRARELCDADWALGDRFRDASDAS